MTDNWRGIAMHKASIWSRPEAETMLRALAAEQRSAFEIAVVLTEALGERVSRHGVIGKAHRLGIPLNSPGRQRQAAKVREAAKRAARRPRGLVLPANNPRTRRDRLSEATALRETYVEPLRCDDAADNPTPLIGLKHDSCRWPFGEPGQADFHFCGGLALDGSPYCARHGAAAHEPRVPSWLRVAAE